MALSSTPSDSPAVLPCQRDLFDIPRDVAYLNCAFMAPQPVSVTEAGRAAVQGKARPWTLGPSDFFDASERARAGFAGLIGVDEADVALLPSVSYGLSIAAQNLPVGPGQRIVVLAEQFPSNVYVWREVVAQVGGGAEVVTAPRPTEGRAWTESVLGCIDDRTAVVAVPNVHWTDGGAVDLVRVGQACRDVGAALVVDATQSLGAMPLDVGRVRPDYLVCAAYKWLLGPYSVAFLYARPDRVGADRAQPIEFNWMNREGAADFASLVDYRERYEGGARRFDVGERSNFVLMPMVVAALDQLAAWGGPAVVAATVAELTERIAVGARSLGLLAGSPPDRGPHMLGVRYPGGLPSGLAERLAGAGVFVSVRGDSVRVSPNVYNDLGDVERLLGALDG